MNFLLVASYPLSILNFRGHLLAALVARGFCVHIACPGVLEETDLRRSLEERGFILHDIPLRRTSLNPVADLMALLALVKLMRAIHPSMVLAYTVKPVIYGMLAARFAGVQRRFALITGVGYAFQGAERQAVSPLRSLLRSLVRGLYSTALRYADVTFFQNVDDRLLFQGLGILRAGACSVVVNGSGVDVSKFAVTAFSEQAVTAPRFLLIARLLGEKGVREYVQAAARLRGRFPAARFSLVGWLDENPDAIQQSELDAWMSQGIVDYLGRLADVRPAIANCSVYVLPSYREGTPRTVLEAMSMGRAVITTDAPGCRETVVHEDNGYLVPVGSVEALEQAMLRFIEDPSLAARMGVRSREIAEAKYDVHKVNAEMLRAMGLV